MSNTREQEFVMQLRTAVERYLQAVNAWENAFQKHYRLLDPPRLAADLEAFQEEYLSARRQLEPLIPRARQLSRKHEIPDPWAGLLHIRLGARTPQAGAAPAIGQGERALIIRCLTDLEALSQPEFPKFSTGPEPSGRPVPRGILGRIFDFFF
jgi:hypothetical protein